MRRPTSYVFGFNAIFARGDWCKLRDAVAEFERFYHGADEGSPVRYDAGRIGVSTQSTFSVFRKDYRAVTKPEVEAMAWFFRGVMVAHKIKPISGGVGL